MRRPPRIGARAKEYPAGTPRSRATAVDATATMTEFRMDFPNWPVSRVVKLLVVGLEIHLGGSANAACGVLNAVDSSQNSGRSTNTAAMISTTKVSVLPLTRRMVGILMSISCLPYRRREKTKRISSGTAITTSSNMARAAP